MTTSESTRLIIAAFVAVLLSGRWFGECKRKRTGVQEKRKKRSEGLEEKEPPLNGEKMPSSNGTKRREKGKKKIIL